MEARCGCGGPAEHRYGPDEWSCLACKAEDDADRKLTAPTGVETMRTIVEEGLR